MTKLQLALDGELNEALAILECVEPFIDIAEVGTPLIFREGVAALRRIRRTRPHLRLVADLKIMDAGEAEAEIAFGAGADVATVMALASDATILGALKAARKWRGQIMVDMMQVVDPIARAGELLAFGCDLLCLHTAHDMQAAQGSPFGQLAEMREALPDAPLAIAGGVKPATLAEILPWRPQVIVVGSAITGAAEPRRVARRIQERILEYARD